MTAIARNFGGRIFPFITTLAPWAASGLPLVGAGLLRLKLSPESKVAPEASMRNLWTSSLWRPWPNRASSTPTKCTPSTSSRAGRHRIDQAKVLTAVPSPGDWKGTSIFTEARLFEVAAQRGAEGSESKTADDLRDENYRQHEAMMDALLAATNAGDDSYD